MYKAYITTGLSQFSVELTKRWEAELEVAEQKMLSLDAKLERQG